MRALLRCLVMTCLTGCSAVQGGARDPGSPTPVTGPDAGATPAPIAPSGRDAAGGSDRRAVPVRPEEAPLVEVKNILEDDSLVGRRVRVAGSCTRAGTGRTAGSWTLEDDGMAIEVRGLVPRSCSRGEGSTEELTIFAQIEPKTLGSEERLLLRLPD